MLLHYGGEPVHICDSPRCAECRKCSHCCQGCEPAEPESDSTQETPREHIANAIQSLVGIALDDSDDTEGVYVFRRELAAITARLRAALTLLDQQESKG